MAEPSFADRYAEAGIAPSAEIIQKRQTSTERIVGAATGPQIIDLVACYYDLPVPDPSWLRDELLKEDATFSLINNKREAQLLSAIMLGKLISGGKDLPALTIVVGHVVGRRSPPEATWLVQDAYDALARSAVNQRAPRDAQARVAAATVKGLEQELAAVGVNDWPKLLDVIGKVRKEAQASMVTMSTQTNAIAEELLRRTDYQREESQILWWVFSGLSRSLNRTYATLESPQAAIVAAIDLGSLTTRSRVGPIAAPALLAKVIAGSKEPNMRAAIALADVVDGLSPPDLAKLEVGPQKAPRPVTPITTALDLARTIGVGAWHPKFAEMTGLPATTVFDPIELSQQLYNERLLGKLL